MNNKRQTIWLVSMLSLMVILSAYYLFTEDAAPVGQTVDQASGYTTQDTGTAGQTDAGDVQITEVDGTGSPDATAGDQTKSDGADAGAIAGTDAGTDTGTDAGAAAGTDANASADASADDQAQTDTSASASPDNGAAATDSQDQEQSAADDSGTSPQDEAVLSEMNNQTGRAYFDNIELQRRTQFSQDEERLNDIIADNSKHTADETASAIEQLHRLDATEERISSLEEKLLGSYDNAVVEQDNDNFKVVVQADKLDKTQAVGIVETAMKELQVTPDRVTVQYIANP